MMGFLSATIMSRKKRRDTVSGVGTNTCAWRQPGLGSRRVRGGPDDAAVVAVAAVTRQHNMHA